MLPAKVQWMLGAAATIGNRFPLALLAQLCGVSELQTAQLLDMPVRYGIAMCIRLSAIPLKGATVIGDRIAQIWCCTYIEFHF